MTTKHTPGPWLVHDSSTLHMNDAKVCDVGFNRKVVSHTERIDDVAVVWNAMLIAAAPDLLAACEAALVTFDVNDAFCKVCCRALQEGGHSATCAVPMVVAAISKAKGGDK